MAGVSTISVAPRGASRVVYVEDVLDDDKGFFSAFASSDKDHHNDTIENFVVSSCGDEIPSSCGDVAAADALTNVEQCGKDTSCAPNCDLVTGDSQQKDDESMRITQPTTNNNDNNHSNDDNDNSDNFDEEMMNASTKSFKNNNDVLPFDLDSTHRTGTSSRLLFKSTRTRFGIDVESDQELEWRAHKIRSELRQAEMFELALEAERAAEAGLESFSGRASTFGDDLDISDRSYQPKDFSSSKRYHSYPPHVRRSSLVSIEPKRKIRVMALRDINEVIPNWGELHAHVRTHLALSSVNENILLFREGPGPAMTSSLASHTTQPSTTPRRPGPISPQSQTRKFFDFGMLQQIIPNNDSAGITPKEYTSESDSDVSPEGGENASNCSSHSGRLAISLSSHMSPKRGKSIRRPRMRPLPGLALSDSLFFNDLTHTTRSETFSVTDKWFPEANVPHQSYHGSLGDEQGAEGGGTAETVATTSSSGSFRADHRVRQDMDFSETSHPSLVDVTPVALFDAVDDDDDDDVDCQSTIHSASSSSTPDHAAMPPRMEPNPYILTPKGGTVPPPVLTPKEDSYSMHSGSDFVTPARLRDIRQSGRKKPVVLPQSLTTPEAAKMEFEPSSIIDSGKTPPTSIPPPAEPLQNDPAMFLALPAIQTNQPIRQRIQSRRLWSSRKMDRSRIPRRTYSEDSVPEDVAYASTQSALVESTEPLLTNNNNGPTEDKPAINASLTFQLQEYSSERINGNQLTTIESSTLQLPLANIKYPSQLAVDGARNQSQHEASKLDEERQDIGQADLDSPASSHGGDDLSDIKSACSNAADNETSKSNSFDMVRNGNSMLDVSGSTSSSHAPVTNSLGPISSTACFGNHTVENETCNGCDPMKNHRFSVAGSWAGGHESPDHHDLRRVTSCPPCILENTGHAMALSAALETPLKNNCLRVWDPFVSAVSGVKMHPICDSVGVELLHGSSDPLYFSKFDRPDSPSGSSLQIAINMFNGLSITETDVSYVRELYVSESENNEFLDNFFYRSKPDVVAPSPHPQTANSAICAEPCQKTPCADAGVESICAGFEFLFRPSSDLPRPIAGAVHRDRGLSLGREGEVELESEPWFDLLDSASSRINVAINFVVGENEKKKLFEPPCLKKTGTPAKIHSSNHFHQGLQQSCDAALSTNETPIAEHTALLARERAKSLNDI